MKKARHRLTITCPNDLELESYPGFYAQIVRNFVTNSLTHAFEPNELGEIMIEVSRQDETLHLKYRDTGKGMTEEAQSKIFEPFYTTKREQGNTGLGLHIVYGLVTQQLHGSIECQSKLGEGTSFFIHIPRESSSASPD